MSENNPKTFSFYCAVARNVNNEQNKKSDEMYMYAVLWVAPKIHFFATRELRRGKYKNTYIEWSKISRNTTKITLNWRRRKIKGRYLLRFILIRYIFTFSFFFDCFSLTKRDIWFVGLAVLLKTKHFLWQQNSNSSNTIIIILIDVSLDKRSTAYSIVYLMVQIVCNVMWWEHAVVAIFTYYWTFSFLSPKIYIIAVLIAHT